MLRKTGSITPMPRQAGRPSKGNRDAILARPPVEFGAQLKDEADRLGLSYGDYLVYLAAKALNKPEFEPKLPSTTAATELDLPKEVPTSRAA